jgi:putative ABC transport system permease protein
MNPLPMLIADLKALRWTAAAIVALVAMAVAVGVAINAQERALRKGSAAAAADFDLLVAAPGSQTQLMLTAVFLQPEALPLLDGSILKKLAADKRVAALAPIALGDISAGYPVVGTTAAFATRWGRLKPGEGRVFARRGEAVLGADVALPLGAEIIPSHATAGIRHPFGVTMPEEAEHRHGNARYQAVGRLPRLGSPWDRAILVPIETVWETHGLGHHGHAGGDAGEEPLDAFLTDSDNPPGVPAIVVKPKGVAEAYALRSAYREGGTMAFFPAEVLVALYGAMGNMRDVLFVASVLNTLLIVAAVLLLLLAVAGLRRRRYALLRALGAPRRYILLVVWLNAAVLLSTGCAIGLLTGWVLAGLVSSYVTGETGLALQFVFDSSDITGALMLVILASALSLVPALAAFREPVSAGLRE